MFPAGSSIAGGQAIVIAANANGFAQFYGRSADYEFANNTSAFGNSANVPDLTQKPNWGNASGSLAIANGGDDIGILTPDSTATSFTFVDGANHGSVTTFYTGAATLGGNQSFERVPANVDTNTAADFVVRTSGSATPGIVTVPEPTTLAAVGGLAAIVRRRRRA